MQDDERKKQLVPFNNEKLPKEQKFNNTRVRLVF